MSGTVRTLIVLIFITVLSYISVDIFYRVVDAGLTVIEPETGYAVTQSNTPAEPEKQAPESYGIITERHLFGSTDETEKAGDIKVEELAETQLNLTLVGTVCSGCPDDCAVIEDKTKRKQTLTKVGDAIAGAQIVKITRGAVVLRVGTRDEVLLMEERQGEQSGTVRKRPVTSQTIALKKTDVDNAFGNMNQLLSQARIRPYFAAGKQEGFMINRIKPGSIFEHMGIRNGDIISGIDDQDISRPDDMLNLYRELRPGS